MSPEPVVDLPDELPSFALTVREKRQANMRKAHAASVEEFRRRRESTEEPPISLEEAMNFFRKELLPDTPLAVRLLRNQMRKGTQSQRYAAAKEFRDTLFGRPAPSKQETEEKPTTIVFRSSIVNRLRGEPDE